jgi:hypothetical protein
LCGQSPAEPLRLDVVDERPHAVDLDDRKQLPIAGFELGIAADVDLAELEAELLPQLLERAPRPLAEMAALRVVKGYLRDRGRA